MREQGPQPAQGGRGGPRPAPRPEGDRYALLLATASLASVLAPLNSTMLAVALPDIRSEFGVGHSAVAWLISAYLIAMAVAQPVGGRLGDELGRGRVLRFGLLAFMGFSAAAALAPSFAVLVALRTGQALVGAAVMPNARALLRESVPVSRLGQANGISESAISLSVAAGPLLGAAALLAGSWRPLFLVSLPVAASALVALALLRPRERLSGTRLAIDWRGAALLTLLLVALTQAFAWTSSGPALLAVAAYATVAAAAALLLLSQRNGASQIAAWSLFRNRSFAGGTSYILATNLVMYTTLIAVPFFFGEVQGRNAAVAGPLLGAMAVLMMVCAPFAGTLSDRFGRRPLALTGAALQVVATLLLVAGVSEGMSLVYMALALGVIGASMGIGASAAMTAALEAVPVEQAGAAAGTNSMMRYFGSIAGVGVLGAALETEAGVAPSVEVFRGLFAFLTLLALAAVAFAAMLHRRLAEERPAVAVEVVGG